MKTMILVFILAIVSFTAVFFAGIHVWAQSLMIFSSSDHRRSSMGMGYQ